MRLFEEAEWNNTGYGLIMNSHRVNGALLSMIYKEFCHDWGFIDAWDEIRKLRQESSRFEIKTMQK